MMVSEEAGLQWEVPRGFFDLLPDLFQVTFAFYGIINSTQRTSTTMNAGERLFALGLHWANGPCLSLLPFANHSVQAELPTALACNTQPRSQHATCT